MKAQLQLALLEGEPPNPIPANASLTQSRKKHFDKLSQTLSSVDWPAFEAEVLELVAEAVSRFITLATNGEEVLQFSIRTEPQSQITFISINTANVESAATYSDNPAEFRYLDLCRRQHTVLQPLKQLNYWFASHQKAADKRLEKSLLMVQQEIATKQLLRPLPLANESRLGISSAKAWYDHEILLDQTQKAHTSLGSP